MTYGGYGYPGFFGFVPWSKGGFGFPFTKGGASAFVVPSTTVATTPSVW